MSLCKGMTLMEVIVVLMIIGVAVAFALPNFTAPSEEARASNAKNNLFSIYSAQQNYNNNSGGNGNYLAAASLQAINTALSLNIQDDGSYSYSCVAGLAPACTAARINSAVNLVIIEALNQPVQLTGNNINPVCSSTTGNSGWCP